MLRVIERDVETINFEVGAGKGRVKGGEIGIELDALLADGVSPDRLYVHLGHTNETGGRKNPFARYHPMLHSKVYYMELPNGDACAFIGSHNMTAFALTGFNGEAAVLLEGPQASAEFNEVRQHMCGVETHVEPNDRTIGILIPATVQILEFKNTNDYERGRE